MQILTIHLIEVHFVWNSAFFAPNTCRITWSLTCDWGTQSHVKYHVRIYYVSLEYNIKVYSVTISTTTKRLLKQLSISKIKMVLHVLGVLLYHYKLWVIPGVLTAILFIRCVYTLWITITYETWIHASIASRTLKFTRCTLDLDIKNKGAWVNDR